MITGRVIGYLELGIAVLLSLICVVFAWATFRPAQGLDHYGVDSPLPYVYLTLPLAVAFWICGIALLKDWRYRWRLHALPVLALIAAWRSDLWVPYVV